MVNIVNDMSLIGQQMLDGVVTSYPHLAQMDKTGIIYQKHQDDQIIPIISGGGSGHEPAHFGFVGRGMLTAAVSGPIFVPPKAKHILEAIQTVNRGKGVFLIIKNFEADLKEFHQAIQEANQAGIPTKYVISHDDISVDTYNFHMRHRGVAGTILLHKILGQAALEGASLDQLEDLALELSVHIHTLAVATRPATIPGQDTPLFQLGPQEISFGIGIHGEPGYRTVNFVSSERLANELVNKLKMKFRWQDGDEYIVLINNLGTTPLMEQLIFTNDVMRLLELEGIKVNFLKTGKYMTSLDMAGLSLTMCPIKNQVWLDYLQAPTQAFAW